LVVGEFYEKEFGQILLTIVIGLGARMNRVGTRIAYFWVWIVRSGQSDVSWGIAMKLTLTATITALLLALPAGAGFDAGTAAYQGGDYRAALRQWFPLAKSGHAEAQKNLAAMYRHGRGVKRNYAEAIKWYRKAAARGNATAQFSLGLMYHEAEGVPQSYAKAAKWYRKAAEQGIALAQFNLGTLYYQGLGVPQNYAEAYKWWAKR
jgi:TPR repeat protein